MRSQHGHFTDVYLLLLGWLMPGVNSMHNAFSHILGMSRWPNTRVAGKVEGTQSTLYTRLCVWRKKILRHYERKPPKKRYTRRVHSELKSSLRLSSFSSWLSKGPFGWIKCGYIAGVTCLAVGRCHIGCAEADGKLYGGFGRFWPFQRSDRPTEDESGESN